MPGLPNALHHRLALAFLCLVLLFGSVLLLAFWSTTRLHHQEVLQRNQLDLAENIVAMKRDLLVDEDGQPKEEGLKQLFHWLMVVNPGIEVYLLDAAGRVMAYDAPPGAVVRDRLDLASIKRFLDQPDNLTLPFLADDPRSLEAQKIFSVAPLSSDPNSGFLYVILEGENLHSASHQLWGSRRLQQGVLVGLAALLLATAAGWMLFQYLTRPLRQLSKRMAGVAATDPSAKGVPTSSSPQDEQLGEVQQLERAFESMLSRLDDHLQEISSLGEKRHELVANISHDLRTPLASLQGYLETLSLKSESLNDAKQAEFLSLALRQGHLLSKRVNELFELTKLDSDVASPRLEAFALAELVQDNLQRFRHTAERRGIKLHSPSGPQAHRVMADISWIDRVLENLIENALRFTPAGGQVTVELHPGPERVEVEVRDTGCGITPDDLPLVFQRAYRCQMKGVPQGEGCGLGLAIAQRIVEHHGDQISVSSVVGQGTTFRFSLPAVTTSDSFRTEKLS